jgi:response regulator of citrate/malate metabolism
VLIKEVAQDISTIPFLPVQEVVTTPAVSTQTETVEMELHKEKLQAVFEQVKPFQSQKYGLKSVSYYLGISRIPVRKYFNLEAFVPKLHPRRSNLLEYEAYLRQR